MMKVLKIAGFGLLAISALIAGFLIYVGATGLPRYETPNLQVRVEVTPEKVERGRKYATMLCASCHMDPTTRKLTGKRMADVPPEFGIVYSKNITKHPEKGIGNWTDGELIYLLRTGVSRDGQYIPPYMIKLPHLSDDDLEAIVAFMRSEDPSVAPAAVDPPGVTEPSFLVKLLSHVVFKPLPYPQKRIPTPSVNDKVAYGRYLAVSLGCFSCHSKDFKTVNELEPEKSEGFFGGGNPLQDQNGLTVHSSNITFDEETGIGKWSEADFSRTLRTGIRPDNRVLGYPMEPMPELSEQDASALYAYLKTVPKLRNAVPRPDRSTSVANADEGKKLYHKYGCSSCHGAEGVGLADLRQAAKHFASDAELVAWLKNPSAIRPGTRMPAWDGIIQESEYAPLVAYVKSLGTNSRVQ